MTRAGRRLVEDFLLPALESGKYGELLQWIDRDKRCFSIRWSHKNAAKWSLDDTKVFQAWDSLKGHYNPSIKGYYMQAKQRFRAALYKLNSVVKLPCEDKHVKRYQLVSNHEKKKPDYLARSKARTPKKEENQTAIPTSVICKNTSYTGKQNTASSEPASSPPSSPQSDESEDKELQRCLKEYTEAQMRAREAKENQNSFIKEESSPMDTSDSEQKESSISPRVPHIPIQPAPSYPRIIHFYESNQPRFESPKLMLVKTYNEVRVLVPDDDDINDVGCVFLPPPPESQESESDALNLSMKTDYESSSR